MKTLFGILAILAITIPAGLFIPRLLAQEPPPQLGQGALHKVEIFNTDKCNANLIAFKNSNESIQVNITVPKGAECDKAVGMDLATAATMGLQDAMDFCVPISSLPDDDPDKLTDPKVVNPEQKSMFYKDFKLCSSPVVVQITWDGKEYNLSMYICRQ